MQFRLTRYLGGKKKRKEKKKKRNKVTKYPAFFFCSFIHETAINGELDEALKKRAPSLIFRWDFFFFFARLALSISVQSASTCRWEHFVAVETARERRDSRFRGDTDDKMEMLRVRIS